MVRLNVVLLVCGCVALVCCGVGLFYDAWMVREQVTRTSGGECEVVGRSTGGLTSSLWSGRFCAGDYRCTMDVYLLLLLSIVGEAWLGMTLVYGLVRCCLQHSLDYIFTAGLIFASLLLNLVSVIWVVYVVGVAGTTHRCNGAAFYVYAGGGVVAMATTSWMSARLCMGTPAVAARRKEPTSPPPGTPVQTRRMPPPPPPG